jgi:hypothetical protein
MGGGSSLLKDEDWMGGQTISDTITSTKIKMKTDTFIPISIHTRPFQAYEIIVVTSTIYNP